VVASSSAVRKPWHGWLPKPSAAHCPGLRKLIGLALPSGPRTNTWAKYSMPASVNAWFRFGMPAKPNRSPQGVAVPPAHGPSLGVSRKSKLKVIDGAFTTPGSESEVGLQAVGVRVSVSKRVPVSSVLKLAEMGLFQ